MAGKYQKLRAPELDRLISKPWGSAPKNSYYGDPSYVTDRYHGLEHLEREKTDDDDGTERVVILGYN